MFRLDGKIALVIGLGQSSPDGWGIGSAIAVALAKQGAVVFGGNRTVEGAAVTKERIEKDGGVCDVLACDATDQKSVQALVDACVARHGRIDILVTNVGRSEPGCPASMPEDVWHAQVDVNLNSVYYACHSVLPIMERQGKAAQSRACTSEEVLVHREAEDENEVGPGGGGTIICVSSVAGMRYIGKPQIAYSSTKAAILQFVKATAVMYAGRGVRLNAVVPGLMHTPYTEQMATRYAADGDLKGFLEKRNAQVPMGRMGDAWDVAHTVVFLASDESRYITGQKIVVDGGITSSTG
ncbi:oxidoreductase ucpa [Ophiostoma piceae UAMH 11346]|uniref:Oxidoreductase ucpa n=1 Tax=Ophiostoma piceae (strain UAMH 11346) TaxID=1262450 RepID=S3C408_OPHP1|nr:oxidoreductase ucpa [Ophiostoma piceae UAMH 11346]